MTAALRPGGEGVDLVISLGLGVDSTAYLVKMLDDPAAHGVDLARTMVIHQLTGSEWPTTRAHADIGKSGYRKVRNDPLDPIRGASGYLKTPRKQLKSLLEEDSAAQSRIRDAGHG
ncbi:hypothetical protein [Streptomyces sp. NPDC052012]|uniref:hypothetical protein n=1 Tax=Streptomyces sp. NPDC052012 TaxID=3155051 RepID=UPI00344E5101